MDQCKAKDLMKLENPSSLLQGDEMFFNRILSRDASKAFSSHIYYRSDEGVPFNWERKPGQPINPPNHGLIPPLSPPPAFHAGSTLPRPGIISTNKAKGLTWSRVLFWKKSSDKESKRSKKEMGERNNPEETTDSGQVENFEFWGSDSDSISMSSPYDSRSSSGSSDYFDGSSSPSSTMKSPKRGVNLGRRARVDGFDWTYSCSPWNLAGVLVCVLKRI